MKGTLLDKQDWQSTYNLTFRCLCIIIVAVEKQYLLHILGEYL